MAQTRRRHWILNAFLDSALIVWVQAHGTRYQTQISAIAAQMCSTMLEFILHLLYPPLGQKCDTSCVLTIWPKRDHQRYSSLFWKEFKEQIIDRGKIVKFRNNLDFGRLEICQLEELHLRLLAMCMMKTEGRLPQNLQSNFDPSRSSFHDHNWRAWNTIEMQRLWLNEGNILKNLRC